MDLFDREKMITLKGKCVGVGRSAGYLHYKAETFRSTESAIRVCSPDVELARFETARSEAREDISALEDELYTMSGGECAHIFATQLLLVNDGIFTDIPRMYIGEGHSAEEAVLLAKKYFFDSLCKPENQGQLLVLAPDVCDIANRIFEALHSPGVSERAGEPCILVTAMPLPSDIISRRGELLGIVARSGFELTSSALVAKALEIPSLSVDEDIFCEQARRYAVLDANAGELYINPDIATLELFGSMASKNAEEEKRELSILHRESVTKDGTHIELFLNISSRLGDAYSQLIYPSNISGLQSDSVYTSPDELPDEEALFEEYRCLCEQMIGKTVIIRSPYRAGIVSLNEICTESCCGPSELYVTRNESLRIQLSAVMRAAVYGPIFFAVSVVDDADEMLRLKLLQKELCAELSQNGHEFSVVKIGAIIDNPAAAIMCDKITDASDFLCVDGKGLDGILFNKTASGCGAARRRLLKNIQVCAAEKNKRAVFSLGADDSEACVREALELGYSTLSIPPQKLKAVKKIISDFP